MKRCIIYARIGGPASEVNNSLMQAQLAGLRTTAKGLGLEVVAELPVFEYGTDGNRQSIKTLARDRRHGLYECVLVKNLTSIECAWEQRVHWAACHSFYCGYRAAVKVLTAVDGVNAFDMIPHTLLLEYHLGYTKSYDQTEQQHIDR